MRRVGRARACARTFGAALAVALMCAGVCSCASHPEQVGAAKVIVINVRGNVGQGESPYLVAGRNVTLAEIRDLVAAGLKQNANQKVLIRGDKYALHGNVAAAVAACRELGIQEVNIGYDFNPVKP